MDIDFHTLEYALSSYSYVLGLRAGEYSMEEWACLIEQSHDKAEGRTAVVLQTLRACPNGTKITKEHGKHPATPSVN